MDPLNLDDAERVKLVDGHIATSVRNYRTWAKGAKIGYRLLNGLTIGFSAAVPVVVLIPPVFGASTQAPWVAAAAGILGACATLCKSIDALFKNHETWLRNDAAMNALLTEQTLFRTRAGQYKKLAASDRIEAYVDRIEALIGTQVDQWTGAENAPQAKS